jgi:sodium transport system permease protein
LRAVFRKEMKDHFRDRRSLLSALVMPLLGPLLFGVIFTAVARAVREDKPLVVPVAGAKNAPNLVAFLERNGATVEEAPADFEAKVRDGAIDLAVSVPEGYGKEFEGGRTARVELFVDNSREKSRTSVRRTQRLLAAWSSQLGALRLIARGVSPLLAAPVTVDEVDLATPEKLAANVLGMLPMFLLMATFIGGMYLAIDSTAGERERGSLEPLLINPVSRAAVVLGKWSAVVVMTWLAVAVSTAGFAVALQRVPLQDLGIKLVFGPLQIAGMLLVLVPLALFAGSLQMLMALFSRTFKEAQTWLSLMMIVPIVPAAFLTISPIKTASWMMAVPVLAQTVLLNDVLRGEHLSALRVGSATLVTAGCAALLLALTVRMLRSEKIIFGRS